MDSFRSVTIRCTDNGAECAIIQKTKEVSNTKNINVNVTRPPTNIQLGRQGENLATCIIFDCTGLVQLYGDGTAELLHELKDGTVYPVAVTQDGASVSWAVSASDTANIGSGRAELRWYVGDTLAKSAKFRTSVSSALPDTSVSTPPAPQQSWVDKVLAAAQEIKDGAISDEKLAAAIAAYLQEHPIDAGLDEAALAVYLVENGYLTDSALADAVAQALAEAKASGQFDGEPGVDGTDGGYYTPSVDDDGNLTWTPSADNMPAVTGANIKGPQGDTGPQGPQGNKGDTGATGAQGPAGADGQPGADGVTPNIQIGTVETLTAGSDATASITGTAENPLLNLGIPKGAGGTSGKSAYQYAQEGGYTGTEDEFKTKLAEEYIPVPTAEDVGKVPTVNANGTGYELTSMSGGNTSAEWKKVAEIITEEDSTYISVTEDSEGNPLSFDEAFVGVITARSSSASGNGSFVISAKPNWVSSFSGYGIYNLALNPDAYAVMYHAQLLGNGFLKITCTPPKFVATSLPNTLSFISEFFDMASVKRGWLISDNCPTVYQYAQNILDENGKLHGITVGVDMASSIQLGAGTRMEVWVR